MAKAAFNKKKNLLTSKLDLKCGAGERWRAFGPIVKEMKKYYIESRRREISYKQ
jgi:hypothetical protein